MRKTVFPFAVAAAGLCAQPINAEETLEELATVFGTPPTVLDISISPSGNKIAYLTTVAHSTEALNVVELGAGDGKPRAILAHADPESQLLNCEWANEERLACRVLYVFKNDGNYLSFTRMVAIDDQGVSAVQLTAEDSRNATRLQQFGGTILALDLAGEPNSVLMTRNWVPEVSTGTRLGETDIGLGVEVVDVTNGKRKKVENPDQAIVSYAADENGQVRLKVRQELDPSGYRREERSYFYRTTGSRQWQEMKLGEGEPEFYPVAAEAAKNVAYGFVDIGGFDAAASVSLDGNSQLEILLTRDDADVDSFIRIGRRKRVVGASYATEKREIAYFDQNLARLSSALRAALPGQPLINIVDASADESRLLIIASSDVDPGTIYLYETESRQLSELLPVRSGMAGREMGKMTPIEFPGSDGTMIPAYLTLPPNSNEMNLPAIVMPHGGPSSRDEWGFDWLVQFFVARGFAVLQPNYRGSAGYGSDWFGHNGFQAWRVAVSDVNDAGRWLAGQGIADPQRLAILGWSYGGYAALQSQVLEPELYKAVVAIAPVTDFEALREESRDFSSFRMVSDMIGDGPHIREGSPARNTEKFQAPVLLFHGTEDQNVGVSQSRLMRNRLSEAGKWVNFIQYDGRDHYIDDTWARANMLMDIDRFLANTLGR